jgi:hypothetical protein
VAIATELWKSFKILMIWIYKHLTFFLQQFIFNSHLSCRTRLSLPKFNIEAFCAFLDSGLAGMTMRITEIATAREARLAMTNEGWLLVII